VFRRALLATLQRFAAPRWNETAKHAWEMAAPPARARGYRRAGQSGARAPGPGRGPARARRAGRRQIADTHSNRDVLCLAGGTGLAPVKAIIEALISAPDRDRHREIVLYYGARRHQDLYDLTALQEMELLYPWLQVIPAVSDEPAHDHGTMYGTVPELAAKATWADREIYISGPDHIIVKTARVLRERGAPDHLIHYDLDPKASQGL
jgi:hypothetical protein